MNTIFFKKPTELNILKGRFVWYTNYVSANCMVLYMIKKPS